MEIGEVSPVDGDAERHGDDGIGAGDLGEPLGVLRARGTPGVLMGPPRVNPAVATTPRPAGNAHPRSARRRLPVKATARGPRNSKVTATPSAIRWTGA